MQEQHNTTTSSENQRDDLRHPISITVDILAGQRDASSPVEPLDRQAITLDVSLHGSLLVSYSELKYEKLWIHFPDAHYNVVECTIIRQVESGLSSSFTYGLHHDQILSSEQFGEFIGIPSTELISAR